MSRIIDCLSGMRGVAYKRVDQGVRNLVTLTNEGELHNRKVRSVLVCSFVLQ
jgi:hypothetical protein